MSTKLEDFVKDNQPFICILVSCYSGTCGIEFVDSLIKTVDVCKMSKIRCKYFFMKEDMLIHRARNNLVAKALSIKDVTHITFIHPNMKWNPYDIFKLLVADKYIIGGASPVKNIRWREMTEHPNCISIFNDKNHTSIPNEVFLQHKLTHYNIKFDDIKNVNISKNMTKVKEIAFDFIMLKRIVFEKMFSAFPKTKYTDNSGFLQDSENDYAYTLFDIYNEKNIILSDEIVFSKRWQNMGGSIWIDITIGLTHTGLYDYNGNYYNSII